MKIRGFDKAEFRFVKSVGQFAAGERFHLGHRKGSLLRVWNYFIHLALPQQSQCFGGHKVPARGVRDKSGKTVQPSSVLMMDLICFYFV
jgi:hypothetical protein